MTKQTTISSSELAGSDCPAGAPDVTDEMVRSGLAVLEASGALGRGFAVPADALVVRRVFVAMLSSQKAPS